MTALAPALQAFFTQRLITQRNSSPETIAAYRDTWRLLLAFARGRAGKNPERLDLADLDAGLITAFLAHLEQQRGNSARTRNTRLAAIHSLFRFAALRHPEHAALDRPSASPPTQALRSCCRVRPQRQADLGPELSCGFLSVPERFRPLP